MRRFDRRWFLVAMLLLAPLATHSNGAAQPATGDAGSALPPAVCEPFTDAPPPDSDWFFFFITLGSERMHVTDAMVHGGYEIVIAENAPPLTVVKLSGDRVKAWGTRNKECIATAIPKAFPDQVTLAVGVPSPSLPGTSTSAAGAQRKTRAIGWKKALARSAHKTVATAAAYRIVVPENLANVANPAKGTWDIAKLSREGSADALTDSVLEKVTERPTADTLTQAIAGSAALTGTRPGWIALKISESKKQGQVPSAIAPAVTQGLVTTAASVRAEEARRLFATKTDSSELKSFMLDPSAAAEMPVPLPPDHPDAKTKIFFDMPALPSSDPCSGHKIRSQRAYDACIEACNIAQGDGRQGNGCRDGCNGMKNAARNTSCWRGP